MKSAILMAAVAVFGAAVCQQSMAAPPSYTMMCRGGGGMEFEFRGTGESTLLTIHFEKGTQSAGRGGLRPGVCTWTDRGLHANEPGRIFVKLELGYFSPRVSADGRVRSMGYAWWRDRSRGEATNRHLRYLYDAFRSGRDFQLRVYQYKNGRQHEFRVTKIGP